MEEKRIPGVESTPGADAEKDSKGKFSKRKGKGNRGNRRGFGKGTPSKGGNDFAFWNEYPELMGIATRYPWMHINGTPLKGAGVNVAIPNVAVQHYFSVPGVCSSATDPLNLAFRQVYLDMHRKYRGVGTYQASDIAICLLCIESVLQLLVEAERIYGILKGYPIQSRVEPEGLLLAMGYLPSFISAAKSDLANFRYSVNRLIELARRLPLPSGMNFFQNHIALNGFVYRDSSDVRSGILVFVCDNYYEWQTTGDQYCINNASTAASRTFGRASFANPNALFTRIEGLLTGLLTDSDILRITSDFIACYGESNMQTLAPLPEDYRVEATYSESILHKWHNSERYGDATITYCAMPSSTTRITGGNFCVYQANDVIISRPVLSISPSSWVADAGGQQFYCVGSAMTVARAQDKGFINDSWMSDPKEEQLCESVLWKNKLDIRYNASAQLINMYEFAFASTEILTTLEVVTVVNTTTTAAALYETSFNSQNSSIIDDGLCHIDWAPYVFGFDSTNGIITDIIGDTDNVTVVDQSVIAKIVDAANLSAFKVKLTSSGKGE